MSNELECDFSNIDIKCIECNELYPMENSSYCSVCSTIQKPVCVICKEYFPVDGKIYCVDCEMHKYFEGKTWTALEIIALPTSSFKSTKLNDNLEIVFEQYKKGTGLKTKVLKNEGMFKQLLLLGKGKSSGEIFRILDGQTDFPPVLLLAKYADQLLSQMFADNNDKDHWKYVHAICPFVFDLWNIKTNNMVLKCYHTHFGELVRCPGNVVELFRLWNRSMNHYMVEGVNDVKLSECDVCGDEVMLKSKNKLKCKSCYKYSHYGCIDDSYKFCGHCGVAVTIKKKVGIDYGSVWII